VRGLFLTFRFSFRAFEKITIRPQLFLRNARIDGYRSPHPDNTNPLRELPLMLRTIFAAALALAAFGFAPALTPVANAYDAAAATQPRIDIPRIKTVLKLTPEQQAYWPPVEAALRMLSHQKPATQAPQGEGLVQRVSNRVYSYAIDAAALARIGAAVRPLVKVLDDRQKNDAIALCNEMGLGQVLAALI
jgi:hypothetical protein